MKTWKLNEIQIRDPFVLAEDGEYFLFGSTDKDIWRDAKGVGFDAYKSSDLKNWEGPFEAFRPTFSFWGKYNFWAPEVHKYKGAYYIFATFRGETGTRGCGILRASHPLGPYQPWSDGKITPEDWSALDGTLYIDKDENPWMVFCHEWIQIEDGTVCAVRLSEDLKRAASKPQKLFSSSEADWSKTVFSPSNNVRGFVTDGCFFHRNRDEKLVLLWSCIGEAGYCIGYAVSDNGDIDGNWMQSKAPLYGKDGGHGMIFEDAQNTLYLSIHTPNDTPNERAIFIEVIETKEGLCLSTAY